MVPAAPSAATVTATFLLNSDALHFVPNPYDFGAVQTGATVSHKFTLFNDNGISSPIDSLTATGAGFAIASTTCGASLAGFGSCDVFVSFTPGSVGALSGILTAMTNGSPFTAALSGTGGYELDVTVTGTGTGSVTSSPTGITSTNSGFNCSKVFAQTTVTLTPTLALAQW